MADAEGIIGRFIAFGESTGACGGPIGAEDLRAISEYFMSVGLVTDVPNQNVFWALKQGVQGDGELGDPKTRSQVPGFVFRGFT